MIANISEVRWSSICRVRNVDILCLITIFTISVVFNIMDRQRTSTRTSQAQNKLFQHDETCPQTTLSSSNSLAFGIVYICVTVY